MGKNNYEAPDANRLNWLTSSRQIIRFKQLKELLKTDVYQLVCSEHEEHWKHEFYLCLNHHALLSTTYYQSNNIHLKSALIIYNFKQWGPDTKDPIDDVNGNEIVNDGFTLTGQHGLKMCIESAKLSEFQPVSRKSEAPSDI